MRSLPQILAELSGWCRRDAGDEVGYGSSNAPADIVDGTEQQILSVNLADLVPAGCDGMATVHLYARENVPRRVNAAANSKLVIEGAWQSGLAGGDFQADGAHGAYLCLGANSSIVLRGRLVSAVEGAVMVVGSTYRVEAVTKWFTSPGERSALLALPSQAVAAGGFSPFFKIPRQARLLSGMALDPAAYATLTAELATAPAAAAIRYSSLIAPRREPIVNGVEWVRFASAVATQVFPTFELAV